MPPAVVSVALPRDGCLSCERARCAVCRSAPCATQRGSRYAAAVLIFDVHALHARNIAAGLAVEVQHDGVWYGATVTGVSDAYVNVLYTEDGDGETVPIGDAAVRVRAVHLAKGKVAKNHALTRAATATPGAADPIDSTDSDNTDSTSTGSVSNDDYDDPETPDENDEPPPQPC